MKSSLWLLLVGSFFLCVGGTPVPGGVVYAAAPAERGAFHVGGKGVYNYGYNTGDGIAKVEVRHPDGSVTGSYRYFDANGRQIVRSYIADNRGFRVMGNDLPIAPNTPAVGLINDQVLTGPVEGTQEFSSPNIVTNDQTSFVITNRLPGQSTIISSKSGTAKSSQVSQKQVTLSQQHSDILARQQELIRQQEKKLEELKLQQRQYLDQHKKQLEELKLLQEEQRQSKPPTKKTVQFQHGYSTSFNKVFGLDSPYFYSDDNINYDFPAGFAYNVQPVYMPNPVGVKGENAKLLVTAGHTSRHARPLYNRKSPFQGHRHPYVIGHTM